MKTILKDILGFTVGTALMASVLFLTLIVREHFISYFIAFTATAALLFFIGAVLAIVNA